MPEVQKKKIFKKRVLLVEDEHAIKVLYSKLLSEAGYEVLHAPEGETALDSVLNEEWDILLLDIMLPRKDGIQVLREAKNHPDWKKGPVVLLTNLNDEKIISEAYSLGADGYLIKSEVNPPDKLITEVENFLSKYKNETG